MFNFQINPKLIHWNNKDTYIFVNPKLSRKEQQLIKVNHVLNQEEGLIWVGSSGTTSESSFKLLGIRKEAFLESAKSVCRRLEITDKDIWLSILPRFHVAGIAVEARSYVSGCKINALNAVKFDPHNFVKLLNEHNVTVTSLVPTQVFEIVKNKLSPPPCLRFIYVGGANLSEYLYQKAVSLGWGVVVTYGMTEAASSVATSRLSDIGSKNKPSLYVLDHLNVKLDASNTLMLKGNSLADAQITYYESKPTETVKLVESDYLQTQDLVSYDEKTKKLDFISRKNDQLKVSGELVNLNHINSLFEGLKYKNNILIQTKVVSEVDQKYGRQLILLSEGVDQINEVNSLVDEFNFDRPSFQKLRGIYFYKQFDRSSLGKISK